MNNGNCPSRDQLNEYISGHLRLDVHESIDSHLDACAACQETVDLLDTRSNKIFEGLGSASPSPAGKDGASFRQLVNRAKSIGRDKLPPPGTVLGNYTLGELIATGGMGRVFKAHHQRMKRDVALKILSPSLLTSDEALRRFQREVEAAAKLNHPNIVSAFDADEADGQNFLVMEYVAGKNLAELVEQDGKLAIEKALDCIEQAAHGLQYAHEVGIIHRDIKPANLLLDEQGTVKVLDMGLARTPLAGDVEQSNDLTTSKSLMGTAAYLSPEQAENPRKADQRADIYGLGCTMYYLLTSRTVFEGASFMEIIFAHREKQSPSLGDLVEDCPAAVEHLFQKMVAKDPAQRFQSMDELIQAITDVRAASPSAATRNRPSGKLIASFAVAAAIFLLVVFFARPPTQTPSSDGQPNETTNVSTDKTKTDIPFDTNNKPILKPARENVSSSTALEIKVAMVNIPIGKFWMGASDDDKSASPDERPRHEVTLNRPFQLGKFEVTVAEFNAVTSDSETTDDKEQNKPISAVSWLDAVRFCNKLSERNGLKPFYEINETGVVANGGDGFRLPTEAEWEYACRANSETKWHFGDDPKVLDDFAWHAGNSHGVIQPVGLKEPNKFGLHDMHGNVPEWCWDRHDPEYYKKSEAIDPPGSPRGTQRVFRGGSVSNRAEQTRSSARSPLGTFYGFFNSVGFRVARTTSSQ